MSLGVNATSACRDSLNSWYQCWGGPTKSATPVAKTTKLCEQCQSTKDLFTSKCTDDDLKADMTVFRYANTCHMENNTYCYPDVVTDECSACDKYVAQRVVQYGHSEELSGGNKTQVEICAPKGSGEANTATFKSVAIVMLIFAALFQ